MESLFNASRIIPAIKALMARTMESEWAGCLAIAHGRGEAVSVS
jgi:hypothetical protein